MYLAPCLHQESHFLASTNIHPSNIIKTVISSSKGYLCITTINLCAIQWLSFYINYFVQLRHETTTTFNNNGSRLIKVAVKSVHIVN